jgi:DNA-directed RNA polymerase subunit N (RpoN/RPB10)
MVTLPYYADVTLEHTGMVDVARDRIIDLEAVAEKLGVTVQCVRNWTKRSQSPLSSFKVGRLVRTTWEAVEQFIKDQEQQTTRQDAALTRDLASASKQNSGDEEAKRILRELGVKV